MRLEWIVWAVPCGGESAGQGALGGKSTFVLTGSTGACYYFSEMTSLALRTSSGWVGFVPGESTFAIHVQ